MDFRAALNEPDKARRKQLYKQAALTAGISIFSGAVGVFSAEYGDKAFGWLRERFSSHDAGVDGVTGAAPKVSGVQPQPVQQTPDFSRLNENQLDAKLHELGVNPKVYEEMSPAQKAILLNRRVEELGPLSKETPENAAAAQNAENGPVSEAQLKNMLARNAERHPGVDMNKVYGQLNPAYYQDYATYFVKWIQAMEAEGIPIEAITPQNEPLNRGNSASLFMGWEEQLSFVRDALGPKLKETGLKTKIYAFDHNYNYDNMLEQQGYPMKIYEDENAASFLTGAAYHNYGGDREELNNVNGKFPDKELIFTETSIGMWNDGRNLEKRLMEDMEETALGTVNNWCKAVIVWNLMLDNERGPNREGGCQTCYGAVDIDRSDYKTITRNSHYYIIGHLSSVVKPGAVRIGSKGYTADGIMYSAFENLDGTEALVLLNNTDGTKNITVNSGERSFTYEVPAKAVASFRWNLY